MDLIKERSTNNYDFLRILAALCIAFTHSFNLLGKNKMEPLMQASEGRFDFSFIGLCLFFSISGYLIAKSACKSPTLKNYLWKRILRIQPLLVLVCLVSVFVIGPVFTDLDIGSYFSNPDTYWYFRNIFPAAGIQFTLPGVFSNNIVESSVNGSLWTLIVEERLYLFMCILLVLKQRRHVYLILMLLLNIFYIFRASIFPAALTNYLDGSHVFYAFIFLNAGALYVLGINFRAKSIQNLSVAVIGLLIIATFFPALNFLYFFMIPFGVIGIANIRSITNRAGKWGDFTYGIYIFSFPIQQMLIASWPEASNPWLLFLQTILIAFPLAILSWHLVEKRFLALKHKVV